MKVVFFGEGIIAANAITSLHKKIGIDYIFTTESVIRNTRKQKKLLVTNYAKDHNIEYLSVQSIDKDVINKLSQIDPDIIVVVSFGMYLPTKLLSKAKICSINLHPSALPKYRGAAPISRAIENGDTEIGLSIIEVIKEMDAGDIFANDVIPINNSIYASQVYEMVGIEGGKMLSNVCLQLINKTSQRTVQPVNTFPLASKITKEELVLNFDSDAQNVLNKIRAFDIFGGCRFIDTKGKQIKIWKAEIVETEHNNDHSVIDKKLNLIYCKTNAIKPTVMQMENKPQMNARDFWNGYQGSILTT